MTNIILRAETGYDIQATLYIPKSFNFVYTKAFLRHFQGKLRVQRCFVPILNACHHIRKCHNFTILRHPHLLSYNYHEITVKTGPSGD